MKSIVLLVVAFVFFSLPLMGQDLIERVASNSLRSKKDNSWTEKTREWLAWEKVDKRIVQAELFRYGSSSYHQDVPSEQKKVTLYLNTEWVDRIQTSRPQYIELKIPVNMQSSFVLQLKRTELTTSGFVARTSSGDTLPVKSNDLVTYRGILEDYGSALAALTIFRGEVHLFIADGVGEYSIERGEANTVSTYYLRNQQKVYPDRKAKTCGTPDRQLAQRVSGSTPHKFSSTSCGNRLPATIFVETDYQLFQDQGSNTGNVTNYVSNLMNNAALVFQNEAVDIQMSELLIWDTPDPYQSSSTIVDVHAEFRGRYGGTFGDFNGNFRHLLTSRNFNDFGGYGQIGFQYFVASENRFYCGKAYSVSASLSFNVQAPPNWSYDVDIFAHETGHNFGLEHTHACVWGVNQDQVLDNCAPAEDWDDDGNPDCPPTNNPIAPTIMSYCNANTIANGFGSEPGDSLRSFYLRATCLSPCTSPESFSTQHINYTSAQLTWAAVSGAQQYTVEWRRYYNSGSTQSAVTANPFLDITGLDPGTTYQWRVTTDCGGCASAWSDYQEFQTPLGVNLDIYSPTISVNPIMQGQSAIAGCGVVNNTNTTAGAHYLKVYISDNELLDAADREVGSLYVSSQPPGTYGRNVLFTIPASEPHGSKFIILFVDGTDLIEENNENDNQAYIPIEVCARNTYYRDADGDGFGSPAWSQQACSAPPGYVANNLDCNDSQATIYPGAPELCDNIDNNCNGMADEPYQTYYRDADGDGYGDPTTFLEACSMPVGYVSGAGDCDDGDSNIYPGAPELCDGVDNDCDLEIDEAYECGCAYRDSLALVALYNATDGPNWTTTWDLNQPMSTWHGVWLDESGCVIQLILVSNELSGSIPSELGNLSSLQNLYLQSNQLSGDIPPELGNLGSLEILRLDRNQLSGSIPPTLGDLMNLQRLYLNSNELIGSIPPELGNLSSLQILWLYFNELSGSIPSELGNLSSLQQLWLSYNELSGSIPSELSNLNSLRNLFLHSNQLSGNIPPELGSLSSLESLLLDNNQLSGSIPPELGSLSSLQSLRLSYNELGGSIPPELGNLSSLEWLLLEDIQLSGSIPPELGNLNSLQELRLSYNELNGSIPSELGNLNSLRNLYLHSNQLSGSIPSELGNLTSLTRLYVQNNLFSGCFPPELGAFCSLGFSTSVFTTGYNFTNNPDLPGGGDFQAFCDSGAGDCNAVPTCSSLSSPPSGSIDISVDADLTWLAVSGATGYRLRVGTTSGGTDILNDIDVGNVITWDPGTLPGGATIYVTVTPYNVAGTAEGCMEESFMVIAPVDCPSEALQINDTPIPSDTYATSTTITSNGTVAAGSTVTFQAGQSITLQPGFHAEAGSDFAAKIEECTLCTDLEIGSLVINSVSSNSLNYTLTIRNSGDMDLTFPADPTYFAVQAYASADDTYGSGDVGAGGYALIDQTLPAGAELMVSRTSSFDLASYNYLIINIDQFDIYEECDEDNNVIAVPVTVNSSSVIPPNGRLNGSTTLTITPNPFRGETLIRYTLPEDGPTQLILFDMLGRPVVLQPQAIRAAGYQEYRLRSDGLSSGIYFVQLRAGEEVITRKVQLLRE